MSDVQFCKSFDSFTMYEINAVLNLKTMAQEEINFILPILIPILSYSALLVITSIGWSFANKFLTTETLELDVQRIEHSENGYEMDSFGRQTNIRHHDSFIEEIHGKSNTKYFLILFLLALFYSLPVFQFVLRFREKDERNCCFNDDCMKPFWGYKDFGGLISNIGYIMMGSSFIVFVYLRQRSFNKIATRAIQIGITHGIHLNFGVFYAMGFALVAEGLFSGGYHICPNKQNFQFDTSFMYAVALLGYVVLYQMRHKKRSVHGEMIVYLALAVFVLSTAIGLVVTDGIIFGVIFSIIYIIGLAAFHWYLVHINKVALVWTIVVNLTLLILFWWTRSQGVNFGTRILYIALGNLILGRICYYLFMKCWHWNSEKCSNKCWQPMIYLSMANVFWISGIIYYNSAHFLWEAKELVGTCIKSSTENCYLSIYDTHDLWHFLSASGLFFSFMMFLTIDDHIMGKSRESIAVF